MKVVISACVFAAVATVASAAVIPLSLSEPEVSPTDQQEHQREKRSSYGPQYISPCGAGAPISLAPASGYHLNVAPVHHGYQHQSYGYLPQYRTEMDEQEMMSFSDMDPHMSEHIPMARYGYGAPVAAQHYGAGLGAGVGLAGLGGVGQLGQLGHFAASAQGPAYGVFPNANVGGCNVPLLLSCSPSISAGKIVKTHPQGHYGAAVGPIAYRGVDDQLHSEHEHHQEEPATHEQISTAHEASHQ